ncbi:MAG: hypothetical protein AAGJ32_08835 [Pseudomonadota bacterium]
MATHWAYLAAFSALSSLPAAAQAVLDAGEAERLAAASAPGETEAGGRIAFLPADFERFSPVTALDMVEQVPGFSIDRVEQSRGLGQASSNVLINGERLSGKSNDAVAVLGRIPAERVLRIELVDASTLGIPGLSGQVVNVVTSGEGLSGVLDWNVRLRERLEPRYNEGEASLSGKLGDLSWTVGLDISGNRFGNNGPEFVFDAAGNLVERRDEDFEGLDAFNEGTIALGWTPPNGHEANLSVSYADFNFTRRLRGPRLRPAGDDIFRVFRGGEDEWNSETSGDYALPFRSGKLKLIGYYRHEDSRFANQVIERDLVTNDLASGVRFVQDFIENEAIGRVEYDWSTGVGRDWQIAAEQAYNRLDAGSDFLTTDMAGAFQLEDRSTPVLVDENRSEISITHTRQVTPKLSLQASLAGEYSELASEVGIDSNVDEFIRPKGYIAATYEVSDALTTTLRVDREVGQLSLFDFVSTRDLNDENQEGGNRSIVPDQTWRFELQIDRKFGDLGGATFTVFHEEIEDLVDQVPLGDGLTGPGNIDSAQLSGVRLDTTLRLDQFGLNGVQLELVADAQLSEVVDPLTGQKRRFSDRRNTLDDEVSFVFAELRWDIPGTPYAVSTAYEQNRSAQIFRIDEISSNNSLPGFGSVQFEHKDLFGLNAFVRVANIYDQTDRQTRLVFENDRLGPVSQRLKFDRDFGQILVVGFSGTF